MSYDKCRHCCECMISVGYTTDCGWFSINESYKETCDPALRLFCRIKQNELIITDCVKDKSEVTKV